jgi:hypothetical protein
MAHLKSSTLSVVRLYCIFFTIILSNSLLWLESLDNYFYNRDHFQISAFLPAWLFFPSQHLHNKDAKEAIKTLGLTAQPSSSHPSIKHSTEMINPESEKLALPPKILFAGDSLMQGVAPLSNYGIKKIIPNW